jgi:FtsH-binding integral membrane protein
MYNLGAMNIIMRMSPMGHLISSLLITIPSLALVSLVDYHQAPIMKHLAWTGFNVGMAYNLCTLGVLGSPLLIHGALATVGTVAGLSLFAILAEQGTFNNTTMNKIIFVGVSSTAAAALASMFFPHNILTNIWLYGGMGVFGMATISDTQKIMDNAKAKTTADFDPINESLGIYLDFLNLYIRICVLLDNNKAGKK